MSTAPAALPYDDQHLQAILLSVLPSRPDDDEIHEWIDITDLMIRVSQSSAYSDMRIGDSATVIADALSRAINRGFVETERMDSIWGDRFRLSWSGEQWLERYRWPATQVDLLLPASDRLVPLNHNSRAYLDVAAGLQELKEELRGANHLPISSEERSRLLSSLNGAIELWKAAELKVIQIKVGIILTIEDVAKVMKPIGKAVGTGLLVDLIKSIIEHAIGVKF